MARGQSDNKMSIGNWLTIVGLSITVAGIGGGVAHQIYATKVELARVSNEVTKTNGESKTHSKDITRLENRMVNLETRQQRMDTNIVKVLERLRVRPAPVPAYKHVPMPPEFNAPDKDGSSGGK